MKKPSINSPTNGNLGHDQTSVDQTLRMSQLIRYGSMKEFATWNDGEKYGATIANKAELCRLFLGLLNYDNLPGYAFICINIYIYDVYACMHVFMHGCMYRCMDVCLHARMHVCMYACMYIVAFVMI